MDKCEEEELESLKLTHEELNSFEYFRAFAPERQEELILLVYELSVILYCTRVDDDE